MNIGTNIIISSLIDQNEKSVIAFEDTFSDEKIIGINTDGLEQKHLDYFVNDGFIPIRLYGGYSIEHGPTPTIGKTAFLRKCHVKHAEALVKKPDQSMIDLGFMEKAFNYSTFVLMQDDCSVAFDIDKKRSYDEVFKDVAAESRLVDSVFTQSFVSKKSAGTVSHYRRAKGER